MTRVVYFCATLKLKKRDNVAKSWPGSNTDIYSCHLWRCLVDVWSLAAVLLALEYAKGSTNVTVQEGNINSLVTSR